MARKQLIQFRRDTAANWTSVNPVLAIGEPGYETDTGKIKYGDGTTAWASLAYFSVSSSGTLTVPNGGTGATSLTSGNVLVGAGTSAVTATKAAPSGAFVGDTDTQTLTNKTLTSPVITTGTVSADPTANLGIASKQYVDTRTQKIGFRAYSSAGVSIATTETKVLFDTEEYDIGNNFASSRFTVVVAGLYVLKTSGTTSTTGVEHRMYFKINGTTQYDTKISNYKSVEVVTEVNLNVGDYVEVFAFAGSAISYLGGNTWTIFSCHLVQST